MKNLFTTLPQPDAFSNPNPFYEEVKRVARVTEEFGLKGIFINSDNKSADPWVLANIILAETQEIVPIISLQPIYLHPYSAAKKIATVALLHNRKVALNFVSGGFKKDLESLGDSTSHNKRYDRLREYAEIIQLLINSDSPVYYDGEYYQITNLKLNPPVPAHLQPDYYLSGSSEAAKHTAAYLNASVFEYPEPSHHYQEYFNRPLDPSAGIRMGIITRKTPREAWAVARVRFPDCNGEKFSNPMTKVSDTEWHSRLNGLKINGHQEKQVYWMGPFKHYHTFCPYLVGSYDKVAEEIRKYSDAGFGTFILDFPVTEDELRRMKYVFKLSQSQLQELL